MKVCDVPLLSISVIWFVGLVILNGNEGQPKKAGPFVDDNDPYEESFVFFSVLLYNPANRCGLKKAISFQNRVFSTNLLEDKNGEKDKD
ncbi:MAG: hypothetical protein P8X90_18295 [Desulfobacterales bacterium]|jgi:hypothetical protein